MSMHMINEEMGSVTRTSRIQQLHLASECLHCGMAVKVILPKEIHDGIHVLWLLHGGYGNCDEWLTNTRIAEVIWSEPIMAIMPSMPDCFYSNVYEGKRYFDYLADELPILLSRHYGIDIASCDQVVVGTSMGGYGAFKLALRNPEQYSLAAGLSGSYDIQAIYDYAVQHDPVTAKMLLNTFGSGEAFQGSDNDLFHLLKQCVDKGVVPRLYSWCGSDDFLYHLSKNFVDYAKSLNVPIQYIENVGAGHGYDYWDTKLEEIVQIILNE